MKPNIAAFLLLTLCLSGCQTQAKQLDLTDDSDKCRITVLSAVPIGTTITDARRTMEASGFTCTLIPKGRRSEPTVIQIKDILHCDMMSKQNSMAFRRWQVMFIINEDKVEDATVTTGLIGP